MPLTTRTITTEVHRLTCDDCGASLEAMTVGALAQMARVQSWKTDIRLHHSIPNTVIAECPKCQRPK